MRLLQSTLKKLLQLRKMPFRMSFVLVAYAVVVCVALLINSIVFTVWMNHSAKNTALKMSLITTSQYMSATSFTLANLQFISARVVASLQNTNTTASLRSFDSSLSELKATFQFLRPPSRVLSLVAQEEVWWSDDARDYVSVGCFRFDTTCFRTNGSVTEYVTSTFPNTPLDFDNIRTVQAPSIYTNLHRYMMRQPQFTEGKGMWTPEIARFTYRETPTRCQNSYIEYVMAYYDCLDYINATDPRAPPFKPSSVLDNTGGFCRHAVVSVIDLRFRVPFSMSGLLSESKRWIQSLRFVDAVFIPSCTADSMAEKAMLGPVKKMAERLDSQEAAELLEAHIEGDNVVTNGVLKMETGILIGFRDVTPKSFYFADSRANLVTSIIITTAVAVTVFGVTLFMWFRVARPLQEVCRSMKRATMGFLETDDEGAGEQVAEKKPSHKVLVKEVLDLYESYNSLRQALRELKAFAPQGLFVAEGDSDAADSTGEPPFAGLSMSTRVPDEGSLCCVGSHVDQRDVWLHCDEEDAAAVVMRLPEVWSEMRPAHPHRLPLEEGSPSSPSPPLRLQPPPPPAASAAPGVSAAEPHLAARVRRLRDDRPVPPPLSMPSISPLLRETNDSPITPASVGRHGASSRLDFPLLSRTTAFRSVTCTTLVISYHYGIDNLELASGEVERFMDICIGVVLAHSGVVESFRPDSLIVSFGAHREDPLHTKRALQSAVRIFSRFSAEQRQRASLVLDTGKLYVGTCGAHNRYARVLSGDRLDFCVRLCDHGLSRGRIVTTENVAQSWHTRKYVFMPFDNIVPRGVAGSQRSSTLLFFLLPREALTEENRPIVQNACKMFLDALSGSYETALECARTTVTIDPQMRMFFIHALRTLSTATPRRPRYCRFELPPFETLGYTATQVAKTQAYRPLLINDLLPAVPFVDFLSERDLFTTPEATGSFNVATGGSVVPAMLPPHLLGSYPGSSPTALQSGASLDATQPSTKTDPLLCGEGRPLTFTDSRGERWTLMPDCIGRGASSEVYKAFSADGVVMAVKCIQLARRGVRMADVVDEVNMSCQLWSEFIVNCTSWAHVGSCLFIVMELLAGGSLYETLRHFPTGLDVAVAKRYATDVLRGLSYLHRNGIVHADVKPQNMLIATDGGCRVSDFGSSVFRPNSMYEMAGDVYALRGTPLYMSPEVARGEPPTQKSDVWSYGLSLYEVLTGHLPWVWRSTGALVYPHTAAPAQRPPLPAAEKPHSPRAAPVSHGDGRDEAAPGGAAAHGSSADGLSGAQASLPASTASPPPPRSTGVASPPPHGPVPAAAVKGLTVSNFLQSVIRGDVVVRIDPALVPSEEALCVVETCLRVDPTQRPSIDDLLFLQRFHRERA